MVSMFESMYIFGVSMWEHVVEVGFLMAFIQLQAGLIDGLLLMATAKLLYERTKNCCDTCNPGCNRRKTVP